MFVVSILVASFFSCQKPSMEANTLNGNWGVTETTLFVSDSLVSTVPHNEVSTYYSFNDMEKRVTIASDGELEHHVFNYDPSVETLTIGEGMNFELEWLNHYQFYLHRKYGNNHSRYLLKKE